MGKIIDHVQPYLRLKNVEVAALCDIDESVLDRRLAEVEKAGRKRPGRFVDMRKILEDKSIDAVSLATPNHVHTMQTIWACQAGKDVYVEKPCAHNMFEARQIVAAAKKYGRIVQQGTNQRSELAVKEAVEQLRGGVIGDVYMARALCFKWRDTIGRAKEEPVPPGVHYDLWIGPAKVRPFTRNRFHYNFHWQWEYGNGDIGNQGLHQIDVARWGLGVTYPSKVSAIGGHFMFDDDQETPNTITATWEFNEGGKKKMMVADVRHWMTNHEAGLGEKTPFSIGDVFYGSNGYLAVENYGRYYSFLGKEQKPGPTARRSGDHWGNFVQAVRSRKEEELNAPVTEGATSTVLVHLANISYRLGRTLQFDAKNWRCTGDEEATRMFTRQYRAPYVVPEKV
jgi:predicted dehydrogenase